MLKYVIVIALRSLGKRKFYTLLNAAGLATSLTFAFLLWLYVAYQNSYDRDVVNAERIYRVNADLNMNGKHDVYANAPAPAASYLKADFPEIIESARIAGIGGLEIHTATLQFNENRVQSTQIFSADPSILKVFGQQFVSGNPALVLTEPNAIVLRETLARKLFGTTDAIGKLLKLSGSANVLRVTGVMKDTHSTTHLPIEAIVSWSTFQSGPETVQWYGGHVYTYVLLNEANDVGGLRRKIPAFYARHMKQEFDQFNGTADLHFQSLRSIHLSPELVWEAYPHGNRTNVNVLSVVIIFLLVFAVINYINLATARATERALEVGVRKILGSGRRLLMAQFLSESVLLSIFAGCVALILPALLLPWFNQIANLTMNWGDIFSLPHIAIVLAASVAIGLAAGLYPAFYLSSLQSLDVVKGGFASGLRGEWLRKALVMSQFLIATSLIASIWIVREQTLFIKNKDIGFEKDNIVAIDVPPDSVVQTNLNVFMERLRTHPRILSATSTWYRLDREPNHFSPTLENADGTMFQMGADLIEVDFDFFKTINAPFSSGRNFSHSVPADLNQSVIINESAMRKFGWRDPLQCKFVRWSIHDPEVPKRNVIGVVKNFNFGPSYQVVNPLIIFPSASPGSTVYARIRGGSIPQGLEDILGSWKEFFPGYNVEISFLDQTLDNLYNNEQRFLVLLTSFSFIILFIVMLGIIGLISFTTALKHKEIAIRKVLGSSLTDIVSLLSGKFFTLLLVANIVAIPAVIWVMTSWLSHFAFRIELGFAPFVVAFAFCLVFTALSLAYHVLNAATSSPAGALKHGT